MRSSTVLFSKFSQKFSHFLSHYGWIHEFGFKKFMNPQSGPIALSVEQLLTPFLHSYSALPGLTKSCHAQDQATTTLHEMTHAPGVYSPGTQDNGYGYAAATALSSAKAVLNADSYALYANGAFQLLFSDVCLLTLISYLCWVLKGLIMVLFKPTSSCRASVDCAVQFREDLRRRWQLMPLFVC
jgi:hypothetical protein